MSVLFLFFWIRSVQNGSNLIKLDQTGFPRQSKNVAIKSCHIYRKDKNGCSASDFFWIRSVQNGSNLIKLDQIGFPHQSKNVPTKSCHIYRKDKNGCFVFDFFWIRYVQNGSNLIKLDFLTNLKILLRIKMAI